MCRSRIQSSNKDNNKMKVFKKKVLLLYNNNNNKILKDNQLKLKTNNFSITIAIELVAMYLLCK